ncbi:MAG: PHP domain-containing protein, partial [Lachnospiraceae bacterium]|nr:PHP domain-containing protein [Lachnospiraceae bacterium]
MHSISYDLHIHTCLSPCGDNDNTPANIIGMAALKGLDVIAITDHNTSRNCAPAIELGKEYGVLVVPGMELTTMEEIHVLCLFPELDAALDFDRYVYERLQKIENDPKVFGHQYGVDAEEKILFEEPYLLINATDIPFDGVEAPVKERGG